MTELQIIRKQVIQEFSMLYPEISNPGLPTVICKLKKDYNLQILVNYYLGDEEIIYSFPRAECRRDIYPRCSKSYKLYQVKSLLWAVQIARDLNPRIPVPNKVSIDGFIMDKSDFQAATYNALVMTEDDCAIFKIDDSYAYIISLFLGKIVKRRVRVSLYFKDNK